MATGWLAWTCLLLAAGSPGADDVVYMNQRGFQIPIRIQPDRQADVRELFLYHSKNKGQNWEINNRALPDRKAFDFFASNDGIHYFSVAVTNRMGIQDPPDVYKAPVGMKICIDTVKPAVRVTQADRVGEEVHLAWEVRDEYPDWTTLKLEYKVGDNPAGSWTPLGIQPGERGNITFRPGIQGDVTVRLALRDLAGNDGIDEKIVRAPAMHVDQAVGRVSASVPPPAQDLAPPVPAPTPTTMATASPAPAPAPVPPPAMPVISRPGNETTAPMPVTSTAAMASGPLPSRGSLPPLQIVNKATAQVGFDVTRYGPSGLGGVDVYVTTDEGATWEKTPGDPAVSLPVSPETNGSGRLQGTVAVQLPKDGVTYGFYLVVKSRAGLGKPAPRNGDAPHVRLERDTTQPSAELYQPQPDPSRGASLVLSWKAEDRNLAANPVALEWSATPTGPWEFIGDAQLPNTGRYTWQVGPKMPPKVYLKLTVRDAATNVAVAQTTEPVLIDLIEPTVENFRVVPGNR